MTDSIDGTRSLIERTAAFAVKAALVESGEPVLQVVTAPAQDEVFGEVKGQFAVKRDQKGIVLRMSY